MCDYYSVSLGYEFGSWYGNGNLKLFSQNFNSYTPLFAFWKSADSYNWTEHFHLFRVLKVYCLYFLYKFILLLIMNIANLPN